MRCTDKCQLFDCDECALSLLWKYRFAGTPNQRNVSSCVASVATTTVGHFNTGAAVQCLGSDDHDTSADCCS